MHPDVPATTALHELRREATDDLEALRAGVGVDATLELIERLIIRQVLLADVLDALVPQLP